MVFKNFDLRRLLFPCKVFFKCHQESWPGDFFLAGTQRYPTSEICSVPGTRRYQSSKIYLVPGTQRYPTFKICTVRGTHGYRGTTHADPWSKFYPDRYFESRSRHFPRASFENFNSQAVGMDSWVHSASKSILRGDPIFESSALFFVTILNFIFTSIFEIKIHEKKRFFINR